MNPLLFLTPMLIILLLGLLWYRMPHLTRPDIFFAVTVKPDFRHTPEALAILRRYNLQICIHTAIAFAMAMAYVALHNEKWYALAIVWQVLGPMFALKSANERTRPFAATPSREFEVEISPSTESLPGGRLAFAIPFAILAASAAILYLNWERIPQTFPIHWGLDGQPNRWVDRTPSNVFGFLLMGVLACLTVVVSALLILRSRRIAVTGEPGRNEQRFRQLNLWTLLGSEYLLAFSFGGLPILTTLGGTSAGLLFMTVTLLLTVTVVVMLVRQGQGGSRLATSISAMGASANPAGDRTPDDCWKWGMLYFNPDDPALFVEKRFGLGYTVNLGNRWSWLLLSGILVVPLASMLLRR